MQLAMRRQDGPAMVRALCRAGLGAVIVEGSFDVAVVADFADRLAGRPRPELALVLRVGRMLAFPSQ
jgi:hypothetical protein